MPGDEPGAYVGALRGMKMKHVHAAVAAAAVLAAPASVHGAARVADPLSFFAGQTESVSTVKVMLKKPFKSRSIGRGKLLPDRSLDLVQRVEDEGMPPHERRWKIRQIGPGRFTGTMSEAVSPVTIDETPKGYRFRFKMKDNLSVEQVLTPIAGGTAARNVITVRKFGLAVARSEGTIRKVD